MIQLVPMGQEITEKDFIEILTETKIRLLKTGLSSISTGEEFQSRLYEVIEVICKERNILDYELTGKHSFPDIRIESFGIEAKFTQGDSWTINGNSITESTKKNDYNRIYVFFGKRGKKEKSDIMFRPHEECVSDIVVTHSPRYRICMELEKGKDVFTKMGEDSVTFNKRNPDEKIEKVKAYYRQTVKKGQEFWWIDAEVGVTPIIRIFSSLDKETQESFKVETMTLFPEIFSRSPSKYEGPTLHLFQKYQARCSSFRDLFTAGGQVRIKISTTKIVKVPKMFSHLHHYAGAIKESLAVMDRDELAKAWNIEIKEIDNIEQVWLNLVEQNSGLTKGIISSIYKAGLRIS